MEFHDEEWSRKGATLSDKTARSEYGLTEDEIIAAINAGKLQYRSASTHGNLWPRLFRREVEELVRTRQVSSTFRERQARTELARVNRELAELVRAMAGEFRLPDALRRADGLARGHLAPIKGLRS